MFVVDCARLAAGQIFSSCAHQCLAGLDPPKPARMAKHRSSLSTRQIGERLDKGLTHHRAGRLAEASACYAVILRLQPAHADALHLSGLIARQQGDLAASERLIAQAIQCRSSVAVFHYNLGYTRELLGKQSEAVECYRRAISLDPQNLAALQRFTGAIGARADLSEAIALYQALLSHAPGLAEAHYDLGRLYHRRNDLSNAIGSYQRAIALQPGTFEFHFNLASALTQSGQFADAAASYRQAILIQPEDAEAHYSLGVVLQKMGDVTLAAQAYARALKIKPEFPNALSNLGFLCAQMDDLQTGEGLLRRAVALDPGNVNAHCNLANLLAQRGNTADALETCRAALALDPNHAPTLCNCGALSIDVGDPQAAEELLRRSIALDPGNVSAHCNLASALAKQGKNEGALESSCHALAIDPKHALTLCNLGALLDTMGNAAGAIQCYQLALASHPDSELAKFYLSLQHLVRGDFATGWELYEARWGTREFRNTRPIDLPPQWRGEDIRGSRILIYSEQGLGDTLQFVRYVPMVAALGATVALKVQPSLVRLLSTFHDEITVVSTDSAVGTDADWQCPLLSLPLAFRTDLATIPQAVPYLRADPIAADAWALRLPAHGLRVGLVWAGNPKHTRDRQRSIALEQLGRLAHLQGVTFYSLQKGPASQDLASTPLRIVDLGEHLEDFTDTAAIIANLDLVICVDTAVAHLAGAMGKPVWLLVAQVGDWRWLQDRADSPWYPSMRLFRQTATGGWDGVLQRIEQELNAMLDAQHPSSAFAPLETCTAGVQV
jgi:tetratricopeptide (TPR) repeat protein